MSYNDCLLDNWVRETELRHLCATCTAQAQDADWRACNEDRREFPVATACHWYKPIGDEE